VFLDPAHVLSGEAYLSVIVALNSTNLGKRQCDGQAAIVGDLAANPFILKGLDAIIMEIRIY
jgi:hypothetical protein